MGDTTLHPLNDRVAIRRDEAESKTPGGIVLPDNAKEAPARGTVVAVGPGRLLDNGERSQMALKIGDNVLFGKYSGIEVKVDGVSLVLLSVEDVFAIVS